MRPAALVALAVGAAAVLTGCGASSSPSAAPAVPSTGAAPAAVAPGTTAPAATTTTTAAGSRDPFAQLTGTGSSGTAGSGTAGSGAAGSGAGTGSTTPTSSAATGSSSTSSSPTSSPASSTPSSSSPATTPTTQESRAEQVLAWWKASLPHLQQLVRQERRTLAVVAADGRTPTYRHDGAVLATTASATTLPCPDAAVSAVWLRVLTAYGTLGHQAATGQFVTSAETTGIYRGLLALKAALEGAGLVFRST